MNRYRQYQTLDDQPAMQGDTAFRRLDMQSDPATLPPGSVAISQNFRFDNDGARVRAGIQRKLASGDTVETIYCAGIYRPEGENDRIALVNVSRLTLFNPEDQTTERYDYPAGENVASDDEVEIIQAGVASGTTPNLYILRGFGKDPLKFNGTAVTVDATFERGEFGMFYQDRIAVNTDQWSVSVSDFLDYATWSLLNQFQILKGSDDKLTLMRPYQRDYVLIGSRKRWFVAHFEPAFGDDGYNGSIARYSFVRELTREAGVVGKRAAHECNGMIWFVSDRGIYAFQPRLDMELTVLGKPISVDIQPLMNRLSADYAGLSCVMHSGHRVYFTLPISAETVELSSVSVGTEFTTLTVPFTVPASVGGGYLATFTSEEAHDLAVGDTVTIDGAADVNLNGTREVVSATDDTFTVLISNTAGGLALGATATCQKVATRPNTVAVYNLALEGWESVDTLPSGMFADFMLVADHNNQRRLWIVDADLGPCLYEAGAADEVTDTVGVTVPFNVPITLTASNFGSVPIAGRLKSRTYGWGEIPRHVRSGGARLRTNSTDVGAVTLTVRTPDRPEWTASKDFDGDTYVDNAVRKRCGRRGIEAEIEVNTTAGRPAVRSLALEVNSAGRDKED